MLYRPLLMSWLRRQAVPPADLDDLIQEILLAFVRVSPLVPALGPAWRIPSVDANHRRQPDSRLLEGAQAAHAGGWRRGDGGARPARRSRQRPNRHWDEEHDRHVLRCLLVLVEQVFDSRSVRAFRRLSLDERPAAEVAAELEISIAAAYQAKSRVLQRIRQEAEGLLE